MYALFQILCASLFFNKLKFRILFKGLIFFLLIILIFGIIGDNRGENPNPFSYLIDSEYFELMSSLPSGFTWVYVYLTANFNNINTTYGNYELSYSLLDIFYNVVPGALKSYFIEPKDSVLITDANLNVASFYAGYITSFGIIGAIVGGIILQLFSIKYYFLALRGNLGHLVVYSILFSCICISVFFDAFMTISTLGQIFLSLFLSHKIKYLQIDQ
jgi:oligosaccharide repeat unit polymerase